LSQEQKTIKPRDLEKYDVIRVTETNDRSFWDVLAGIEKRPVYDVQIVDIVNGVQQILVIVFLDSYMTNEHILATRSEIASLVREADSTFVRRRVLDGERLNTVWMRLSA
jgi:hypothetical protein